MLAAHLSAADRDWTVYQPGNSACTIKFPANPEYQTQIADGMLVHVYIAKDSSQTPPATYALSFGDFAKEKNVSDTDAVKKILDLERDNFVKAVNGKLLSEKSVPLDNGDGRELLVASEDGKARYAVREYLVGSRIFHLIVWMPAARAEAAASDLVKFYESFQAGK